MPFRPPADTSQFPRRETLTRDYRSERQRGRLRLIEQALAIREQASSDQLSDDRWMYLVRVLLDCPLPYRPTPARKIRRRTRLANGWVSVIYTARYPDAQMPFGADARLLHWLIDREIQTIGRNLHAIGRRGRTLDIKCVRDFLVDCGLSCSGENYQSVQESFQRLSGLRINIDFEGQNRSESEQPIPVLDECDLPVRGLGQCDKNKLVTNLRGIALSPLFYKNGAEYCARVPRQVWRLLKGKPQKGAILLWLYVRQYAAEGISTIPWHVLRQQLSCEDSNSGRLKSQIREAVCVLRAMWPMINMRVENDGLVIGRAAANIVPDDPTRRRLFRRPRKS